MLLLTLLRCSMFYQKVPAGYKPVWLWSHSKVKTLQHCSIQSTSCTDSGTGLMCKNSVLKNQQTLFIYCVFTSAFKYCNMCRGQRTPQGSWFSPSTMLVPGTNSGFTHWANPLAPKFYVYEWLAYMYVYTLHACSACRRQKRVLDPRNWCYRWLWAATGCWEPNLNKMEEWPVLLIAQPSF